MNSEPAVPQPEIPPAKRRSRRKRIAVVVVGLLLLYAAAAYIVMPLDWRRYVRRHPASSTTSPTSPTRKPASRAIR